MKTVITMLSQLIDEIIKKRMDLFIDLGKTAKILQKKNAHKKDIEDIHSKMYVIYSELYPFECLLREKYPEMVPLFDVFKGIKK